MRCDALYITCLVMPSLEMFLSVGGGGGVGTMYQHKCSGSPFLWIISLENTISSHIRGNQSGDVMPWRNNLLPGRWIIIPMGTIYRHVVLLRVSLSTSPPIFMPSQNHTRSIYFCIIQGRTIFTTLLLPKVKWSFPNTLPKGR